MLTYYVPSGLMALFSGTTGAPCEVTGCPSLQWLLLSEPFLHKQHFSYRKNLHDFWCIIHKINSITWTRTVLSWEPFVILCRQIHPLIGWESWQSLFPLVLHRLRLTYSLFSQAWMAVTNSTLFFPTYSSKIGFDLLYSWKLSFLRKNCENSLVSHSWWRNHCSEERSKRENEGRRGRKKWEVASLHF